MSEAVGAAPSIPRRAGAGGVGPARLAALLLLPVACRGAANFNPAEYLSGSGYTAKRDSVVVYTADSLAMDVKSRRTHLSGSSRLSFLGMTLDSPQILLDWEHDRVEAWTGDVERPAATADSCGGALGLGPGQSLSTAPAGSAAFGEAPGARETRPAADSLGLDASLPWPIFTDGSQTLYGRSMSLDIRTRQGFIREGRTAEDLSLYGGRRIKRVASQEMHVAEAVFTTCDEGCPHYHFEARQLKMLVKDRVFARGVTLHFGRVPTLYSPVALFSLKRGRASGLILPSYGQTEQQGRKLDHLGWYWAAAPTWDTQARLSYAELGPDWLFQNITRYKWNAQDRGQFAGSYNLTRTSAREGWDTRWSHDQSLTPYLTFRSKVALASSKQYYEYNSDNLQTRLTQNLSSNVSLSGLLPEQGLRWTLNASGNQNLETGSTTGSLPVADLSFPTWTPLRFLVPPTRAAGSAGAGAAAGAAQGLRDWLGGATLKVSSRAESRYEMERLDLWAATNRRGARHSLALSFPGKVGVLALTPSFSAASVWVDETSELRRRADGGLDTVATAGFAARQTFTSSLAASTQLYGVLYPRIGKLEALRHVVSPSVSATWTPDFSSPGWGYVRQRSLGDTAVVRLDRFREAIYGGTPGRESLTLGMSLGQLWQSKWAAPATTPVDSLAAGGARPAPVAGAAAQPLKSDLLRLTTTSSYDFKADSLRLTDFVSSWSLDPLQAANLRLGPISTLNMQLRTVHSPYQYDSERHRRRARYRWQDGRAPRMTQTSVTVSTRLGGGRAAAPEEPLDDEEDNRFSPRFGSADLSIPWNLDATWSWSLDKSDPTRAAKRSLVDLRGSLNLSRHWKLSSGLHYDLEARSFSSQSLNIYRDMHCWEGYFTWDPRRDSYHLLIRVKSDLLEDLKWDKRKGRSGLSAGF